jgi:molecular chaperone DnaK
MQELNNQWQNASQEMYQASQAEGQQQPGPEESAGPQDDSGKDDGEVTDVDFEEVKDDK